MSKHETRRGGYAPWCSQYGDMWRTSNDINADWQNVLSNLETLVGRGGDAGPFVGWNDPDILEVGVTRPKLTPLTLVEAQSHFALYVPSHVHLICSFLALSSRISLSPFVQVACYNDARVSMCDEVGV